MTVTRILLVVVVVGVWKEAANALRIFRVRVVTFVMTAKWDPFVSMTDGSVLIETMPMASSLQRTVGATTAANVTLGLPEIHVKSVSLQPTPRQGMTSVRSLYQILCATTET